MGYTVEDTIDMAYDCDAVMNKQHQSNAFNMGFEISLIGSPPINLLITMPTKAGIEAVRRDKQRDVFA